MNIEEVCQFPFEGIFCAFTYVLPQPSVKPSGGHGA